MPIVDWSDPMTLATVYGDLTLNATSGQRYLVDQAGSDHWNELRSTTQDIPQADGSLQFERFTGGSLIKLKIQLWYDDDPAAGDDLRLMVDTLSKHIYSLIKAPMSGRLFWTPSSVGVRLQDYVRMASRAQWEWGCPVSCTVLLDSPFPYAIDFTQTLTTFVASSVLNNTGSTTMYPVFKVYGPAATFVLSNDTTDLAIVFDDNLPGASAIPGSPPNTYLEIDTFRSTAYMTTDAGVTFSNYKPGIDPELTDFFGLVPGNNVISLTTAPSVGVLWQAAWV